MKTTEDKRIEGAIMRRYLMRLLTYSVGWAALLVLIIFMGVVVGAQITWHATNPLYWILSFMRDYIVLLALFAWLVGEVVILIWQWRRVAKSFLALAGTVRQLSAQEEAAIALPEDLREIQSVLQKVQAESIRNRHLAAEAEQRKNDLVVYLAHDLKTPLTSVLGYLTLLRDEKDISPQLRQKYLDIAAAKALRLEDLINEFFEITRFNLKGLALEAGQLDLARMLQQLASEFAPIFRPKNLTASVQVPEQLALVADAGKLERVFDNLLRNAASYSYPGSEIILEAKQEGANVFVRVQNKGDTIPPHKLAHVFEQFYRVGGARGSEEGGAGLGLAIAKEIVELHGGAISVQSRNNMVEFIVVLPVRQNAQGGYIATAGMPAIQAQNS